MSMKIILRLDVFKTKATNCPNTNLKLKKLTVNCLIKKHIRGAYMRVCVRACARAFVCVCLCNNNIIQARV